MEQQSNTQQPWVNAQDLRAYFGPAEADQVEDLIKTLDGPQRNWVAQGVYDFHRAGIPPARIVDCLGTHVRAMAGTGATTTTPTARSGP